MTQSGEVGRDSWTLMVPAKAHGLIENRSPGLIEWAASSDGAPGADALGHVMRPGETFEWEDTSDALFMRAIGDKRLAVVVTPLRPEKQENLAPVSIATFSVTWAV